MPCYMVTFTRTISEYAVLYISAKDKRTAERKAKAELEDGDLSWSYNATEEGPEIDNVTREDR